jgi:hypothetical protein
VSKAHVKTTRGVAQTEYQIKGDLESVYDEIESLFVNFPAFGYGTHVHMIFQDTDGKYVARVSHSNSCD